MRNIFVGRKNELNKLNELLQETKQGLGKIVFVKAEAGGGKTALIRHFIEQNQLNAEVLESLPESVEG